MPVEPYLFFGGNCAEAMSFYKYVVGGELQLLTYEQSPDPVPAHVPKDKVMHSRLVLPDGAVIMASDDVMSGSYRGMSGFGIFLAAKGVDEVHRIFNALAGGGQVMMPVEKTFWSPAFGALTDRFGTPWMIAVATQG